jgi:hypothetical protein
MAKLVDIPARVKRNSRDTTRIKNICGQCKGSRTTDDLAVFVRQRNKILYFLLFNMSILAKSQRVL